MSFIFTIMTAYPSYEAPARMGQFDDSLKIVEVISTPLSPEAARRHIDANNHIDTLIKNANEKSPNYVSAADEAVFRPFLRSYLSQEILERGRGMGGALMFSWIKHVYDAPTDQASTLTGLMRVYFDDLARQREKSANERDAIKQAMTKGEGNLSELEAKFQILNIGCKRDQCVLENCLSKSCIYWRVAMHGFRLLSSFSSDQSTGFLDTVDPNESTHAWPSVLSQEDLV